MADVAVVTDSTCYLPASLVENLGNTVVSLYCDVVAERCVSQSSTVISDGSMRHSTLRKRRDHDVAYREDFVNALNGCSGSTARLSRC